MLRSVDELKGFKLAATDGEIGDVEEFYFDDERWALRYMVVNTGNWLAGKQVLVSPFSVMQVDREHRQLQVALTKSQVEKSPDIDTRQPVSRQMEAAHSDVVAQKPVLFWLAPKCKVLQIQGFAKPLSGFTTNLLSNYIVSVLGIQRSAGKHASGSHG